VRLLCGSQDRWGFPRKKQKKIKEQRGKEDKAISLWLLEAGAITYHDLFRGCLFIALVGLGLRSRRWFRPREVAFVAHPFSHPEER
jgi:hypothetical protein